MIVVLIAAMGMCACIVSVALVWYMSGGKLGSMGIGSGTSSSKRQLKGDIPNVSGIVKGEKAADIVGSTMFADLYPGVQVVTRNATDKSALPAGPAFILLQDASGTVVGVDAAGSI
jgi:hypothetical protein